MIKHMFKVGVLCFSITLASVSCNDDDTSPELSGNWIERSDFEGLARASAVTFTVDDKAYVGTGFTGEDYLKDFWAYDSDRDFWQQVASMPDEANARSSAVAFAASGKGYVGTGYNGTDELNDFWEYDPTSNAWLSIADFGGSARYGAVSFSIDNKGYVGTGFDGNDLKDLWQYDPTTGEWLQKVSVGGSKRSDAIAFVIDGKGYVGTGRNNGVYEYDFWEYDPETDSWEGKNDLDEEDDYTIARYGASAFSLDGKGYIVGGSDGSTLKTVWEYDPVTDLWEEKTVIDGSERIDAVAFMVNSKPYVTTGRIGTIRLDDIWEFEPNEADNEDD